MKLSEENKKEIVVLFNKKIPIKQIANTYNVNRRTIWRTIKNGGATVSHKYNPKLTLKNKEEIIEMYRNNISVVNIAKQFNIYYTTVYKILKNNNIECKPNYRKYNLDENAFSIINQRSCYWAGFSGADGCIYKNMLKILLQGRDKGHLIKFLFFLKANYPVKDIRRNNTIDNEICIYSKKITADLLNNFNIFPNKSFTISMPNLPADMFRHYIRGYFDGDGCITWNKKYCNLKISIVSGSNKQLETIKKIIFEQTGIQLNLYSRVRSGFNNTYTIEKTGKEAISVLEWLYKDCEDYLDRKIYKLENFKKVRNSFELERLQKKFDKKFCGRNLQIFNLRRLGCSLDKLAEMFNLHISSCGQIIRRFKEIGKEI